MDVFDWINKHIGPIAIIATIFGALIAYITWINPFRRMKWLMFWRVSKWEKRIYDDLKDEYEQWVFKPNPAFRIHVGKIQNGNFINEPWLPKTPSGTKSISFEVHIIANGVRIERLYFIGLDDLRLFVPLPTPENDNSYRYSDLQIKIYKIIGRFDTKLYGKNLETFARTQNIMMPERSVSWFKECLKLLGK